MTKVALQVEKLVKEFAVGRGMPFSRAETVHAVDGVSFRIAEGRTLGIVGESGCGKSTTAKLVLRLEKPTSGAIRVEGEDIASLDRRSLRRYRKAVQAVFQDPFASLNPRMRVSDIISEPLRVHEQLGAAEIASRVAKLLSVVGLPARSAELFPHEFSGGQRQRIAIARALSLSPRIIVLDEPVSALDVSIRAQILNLLRDLQDEFNMSYMFITHDLAAVAHMSHDIVVMYLGRVVERGDAADVSHDPKHPYTQALFQASLADHPDQRHSKVIVRGEVPSPISPPSGCHFHPRCPFAMPRCSTEVPAMRRVERVEVACHLYDAEGARPQ